MVTASVLIPFASKRTSSGPFSSARSSNLPTAIFLTRVFSLSMGIETLRVKRIDNQAATKRLKTITKIVLMTFSSSRPAKNCLSIATMTQPTFSCRDEGIAESFDRRISLKKYWWPASTNGKPDSKLEIGGRFCKLILPNAKVFSMAMLCRTMPSTPDILKR